MIALAVPNARANPLPPQVVLVQYLGGLSGANQAVVLGSAIQDEFFTKNAVSKKLYSIP